MLKRMALGDRVFVSTAYILVLLVVLVTLYPFWYIVIASISSQQAVVQGKVWLFPKGINLEAYKIVVQTKEIWSAYLNTIWYVVVGSAFGLFMTTITAYPLSRKRFAGRNVIMIGIAFTMFFGGGLVPVYLLIRDLHMIDTRWALVIPTALSCWNIIIMRTFFQGIPEDLFEASYMDGCSELRILVRIVLPLSLPVIAVMILFFAVGQWNSYFQALVYLNDQKLYPLQMILRKILIQYDNSDVRKGIDPDKMRVVAQSMRYATIIVSTLPILCVYPFLQKYFVKGVMIGAIKG